MIISITEVARRGWNKRLGHGAPSSEAAPVAGSERCYYLTFSTR